MADPIKQPDFSIHAENIRALELHREIRLRYTTERQLNMDKLAEEYSKAGVTLKMIKAWAKAGSWRQTRKMNLEAEDLVAAQSLGAQPECEPDELDAQPEELGPQPDDLAAQPEAEVLTADLVEFEQRNMVSAEDGGFVAYLHESNARLRAVTQVMNLEVQSLMERAKGYEVELARARELDQIPPKPAKWIPSGAVRRVLSNIKLADDLAMWQTAAMNRARLLGEVLRAVPTAKPGQLPPSPLPPVETEGDGDG